MKALDLKNKILDDIVSDLKRPDFLVCNEGKERYWLTDGTASDMSRMRATAHLELMVKRRYEAAMKKAGAKLLPLGAKKLTGIAGSIVKYALSENVIQEALEWASLALMLRDIISPAVSCSDTLVHGIHAKAL